MKATELHARRSADFEHKLAHSCGLLSQAAHLFAPEPSTGTARVSLACSLGVEDMVLAHLIEAMGLNIGIFVLDTGRLHVQTLQLLHAMKAQWRTPIEVLQPQTESVVRFVQREGKDAMYRSVELRQACCAIRKLEPLERALTGKLAWITGLRREQSEARAEVPFIDESDPRRRKYNPLADWTTGDVWHYIRTNEVPYNALHDQFYPSIGCEPCTRAVALGEDFRAGRWWWESEHLKECGLHVTQQPVPALAADDDGKPDETAGTRTATAKNQGTHA